MFRTFIPSLSLTLNLEPLNLRTRIYIFASLWLCVRFIWFRLVRVRNVLPVHMHKQVEPQKKEEAVGQPR